MLKVQMCIALALLLGAFVGCDNLGLEDGGGIVTLDGEPLPNAKVEFIPSGTEGVGSEGTTDEDGKFMMAFSMSQTGVLPGEYTVRISTGEPLTGTPELVPKKYNLETELSETALEGEECYFEFHLETDGETIEQGAGEQEE